MDTSADNITAPVAPSSNKLFGILIVGKDKSVRQVNVKRAEFDLQNLYKKCGFKSSNGFVKQHTWTILIRGKTCNISVYAKASGKANAENKYEFPPPIAERLFFGNCSIIATSQLGEGSASAPHQFETLRAEDWSNVCTMLLGGIDYTNDSDDESDDPSDADNLPRTKDGYVKDGFVVDDDYSDDGELMPDEYDY
jgi:hypothetical protein